MATQVQLRGGTTSEHSSFTGAAREVTVDTDKDVVVVHDGSTAGGIPLATEANLGTTTSTADAALPKAGGIMTGNIMLGDNVKAKFGAGSDLQIYHSGTGSVINENGTGALSINTNGANIQFTKGFAENLATFNADGACNFYNNNALKLATTSTGVDVTGSVTCDGFTSTGIDDNATSTAITIDASENVGIGTGSPSAKLELVGADLGGTIGDDTNLLTLRHSNGNVSYLEFTGERTATGGDWTSAGTRIQQKIDVSYMGYIQFNGDGNDHGISFGNNNTEHMRIDSSGNWMLGTTNSNVYTSSTENGLYVTSTGQIRNSVGAVAAYLNRTGSDGTITEFRKDGTTVGSIATESGYLAVGSTNGQGGYLGFRSNMVYPSTSTGANRDNIIDLGGSSQRFDDIYATNGTIQTSDRNEKQDIEELSEAEQRVAVACKGLLRKFRWQDAVAEKGDDARIHFGIIAQDLQDAFAAEGLDAGRYAMFISSTWYEKLVPVDAVIGVEAVEATYDDEGAELTPAVEAVEAKDAYTRTDTEDEPTDGYTERTRLGVRYPELLAFIISAI